MDMNEMLEMAADMFDEELGAAWIHEGDQMFAELNEKARATPEFYRGYLHCLMDIANHGGSDPVTCTILASQIYKRQLKGMNVYDGTPR